MSQSRTALPQWLSDYRPEAALAPEALQRKALAEVADWGLPGRQDEEWRWTPLRPVTLLQPKANPVNAGAAPLAAVLPEALVIRFVAGKLLALPANLPAGLSVRNLADAEEHLRAAAFAPTARNANDTLLALNTAHASAGIVIELAPNTVLDQPILIDWQDDGDGYAATRTLLRLGAHSQLTLIESVHAHTRQRTGATTLP